MIFYIGTVEPCTRAQQKEEKQDGKRIVWHQWFQKPQFYMVGWLSCAHTLHYYCVYNIQPVRYSGTSEFWTLLRQAPLFRGLLYI